MQNSLFHIETLTGPPVAVPEGQISVRSKYIQLRFPTVKGGLIWNRPVAVVVHTENGQEKIVPILDVTRIVLVALLGLCFLSTFALMLLKRQISKS